MQLYIQICTGNETIISVLIVSFLQSAGPGMGKVLYLKRSTEHPDYRARITSVYKNLADMCLRFYYNIPAKSSNPDGESGSIRVIRIFEDQTERVLKVFSGTMQSSPVKLHYSWTEAIVVFSADGLARVAIEGRRSVKGYADIAVDDLELGTCSELGVLY